MKQTSREPTLYQKGKVKTIRLNLTQVPNYPEKMRMIKVDQVRSQKKEVRKLNRSGVRMEWREETDLQSMTRRGKKK